ncbi:MAG: hypothetical protein J4G12_00810 [Gemmatimonadetes bacterium]|nr:hypothetical protein [Gemmatimonadota bacterium]
MSDNRRVPAAVWIVLGVVLGVVIARTGFPDGWRWTSSPLTLNPGMAAPDGAAQAAERASWTALAHETVGRHGAIEPILGKGATVRLLVRLAEQEGYRAHPYPDAEGWTVGIGKHAGVTHAHPLVTRREALEQALADARTQCGRFETGWPPLMQQPIGLRIALCDAAFQLGSDGLLSFQLALGALETGDCDQAAWEFRDSRWTDDTPRRVAALASTILETCTMGTP